MNKNRLVVSWLCLMILLLLIGCNRQISMTNPEISLSPSPPVSFTSISPSATSKPTPTLNPSERQLYLTEHLPTNNDCALPCWLGITPGKTTWQEARIFLGYLGINRMSELEMEEDKILHSFGGFDFEVPRLLHRFYILEEDALVKGLVFLIEGDKAPREFQTIWQLYSPRSILLEYGPPSRAWLDTTSETMGDRHGYGLILAFDKRGIIIHYEGFLTKTGSNLQICPRFENGMDIQYMEVYLQAPDNPRPLEEFGGILDRQYLIERSKRIEEASGLSEEQLYEQFTQTEQPACINSPVNIWPEHY